MKTPIKLQFVHISNSTWISKWNGESLQLCNDYMVAISPNQKPVTLVLRKTPANGFQRVKLWASLNNRSIWRHDQSRLYNVFLGSGIDHFLPTLAAGKTKLTLYFKFEQKQTPSSSPL